MSETIGHGFRVWGLQSLIRLLRTRFVMCSQRQCVHMGSRAIRSPGHGRVSRRACTDARGDRNVSGGGRKPFQQRRRRFWTSQRLGHGREIENHTNRSRVVSQPCSEVVTLSHHQLIFSKKSIFFLRSLEDFIASRLSRGKH
jgi:hypothetical protein